MKDEWMDELSTLEMKYISIGYQIGDRAYQGKDYSDLLKEGREVGDRILKLDPENEFVNL